MTQTVCPKCAARWTGANTSHCGACHQTFSGIRLFDRHRTHYGEHGRCWDPTDIVDSEGYRIMWPDNHGIWRSVEAYNPRPAPQRKG